MSDVLVEALEGSIEAMRSSHAVACRFGDKTNWEAFAKLLEKNIYMSTEALEAHRKAEAMGGWRPISHCPKTPYKLYDLWTPEGCLYPAFQWIEGAWMDAHSVDCPYTDKAFTHYRETDMTAPEGVG